MPRSSRSHHSPGHLSTRAAAVLVGLASACNPGAGAGAGDADAGLKRENSDAVCDNGVDDDHDGAVDCADRDCREALAVTVCHGTEDSLLSCHDGDDNDGDGLFDCDDPDCEASDCFETDDAACSDGRDNDEDGAFDCDDRDCLYGCLVTVCSFGPTERSPGACSDGADNDGDGRADCQDIDCRECAPACGGGRGENSFSKCRDGSDNDGDGAGDCHDIECLAVAGLACDTGAEKTPVLCNDGSDNDGDPWIDCADPDCFGVGNCTETNEARCEDGVDNDGDTWIDCLDADCRDFAPCREATDLLCRDGRDNDDDGRVDCDDFDCAAGCAVTVCGGEKSAAGCADNVDNDGDGAVDCQDSGCRDCVAACAEGLGEDTLALCQNGSDDDGDGATDCRDTECFHLPAMTGCDDHSENDPVLCADGIDNDNDPFIDCRDPDCAGVGPCTETGDVRCSDHVDNDGDPFVDCADYDCRASAVCTGLTAETGDGACGDGVDNDNDGATDCADVDCAFDPALAACPPPVSTTIAALQAPGHPMLPLGQVRVRVALSSVTVTTTPLRARGGERTFFVQETFPIAGSLVDTRGSGIPVVLGDLLVDVAPGDVVDLLGFYDERFGASEIVYGAHTLVSVGSVPTATLVQLRELAVADIAESYAGVLLRVGEVVVTDAAVPSGGSASPATDDFLVLEPGARFGAVPLVVSTAFAPAPAGTVSGARFSSLVGPLRYAFSRYRLAPRGAIDYGASGASTAAAANDDDGDGLTNAIEIDIGTDPTRDDTDGDGALDLAEVVDPSMPADHDCDGRPDAVESSAADSDGDGIFDQDDFDDLDGPLADADGDGLINRDDPNDDGDSYCDPQLTAPTADCTLLGDNCRAVPNINQRNADADGRGDACDPDIDGDGRCNPDRCQPVAGQCDLLFDNCPADANPGQEDRDGDGIGDECDADADGDGICDPKGGDPNTCAAVSGVCVCSGGRPDNCPELQNADQRNHDGDIPGDACDDDDDNDGLCDPGVQEDPTPVGCRYFPPGQPARRWDNCAFVVNPAQVDSDGDGVGDACEVSAGAPAAGDLLINEVLADPASDANRDGVADFAEDEFVELVNVGSGAVTLAGCELYDSAALRHRFTGAADPTEYLLPDNSGAVVFGGGTPPVSGFGGARVFIASTGSLALDDAGDSVTLRCPGVAGSVIVATMSFLAQADNDQSLTLSIDGDGSTPYVLHSTRSTEPYSPGTCADGGIFSVCLP